MVAAAAVAAALSLGLATADDGTSMSSETGRLAITFADLNQVGVFALDGTPLASIPTGLSPRGMAVRGGELFVANRGRNEAPGSSLTVIDLETLQPVRTVYACVACAPYDLLFDAEDHLWYSGQADRAVYRMVPPYEGPHSSVLVSWGWPTQLALVEGMGRLVVGMRSAAEVALIDTRLNKAERITLGAGPAAVASRPGAPEAWAALDPTGHLARIEVRGDAGPPETEMTKVGNFPADLQFLPDGKRLLMTLGQPLGVALYDATSGERLSLLSLTSRPGALDVAPSGDRAAVLVPGEQKLVWVGISVEGELSEEGSFELGSRPMRVRWLP
jgi:DNA-binding beta-propeller fold protein YncE